jgi:hypothetical protein
VLSISECQCCSLTKRNVQALENEAQSMTEIINISRDELKYMYTTSEGSKPNSTYAEKLKTNWTQYCNRTQLESQLQSTLQELSSVKLITGKLNERNRVSEADISYGPQGSQRAVKRRGELTFIRSRGLQSHKRSRGGYLPPVTSGTL